MRSNWVKHPFKTNTVTIKKLNSTHTGVHQLLGHVLQAVDLLLLRSVDDHGRGAQDAEQAAELPVQVEALRQEVGRQHSTAMTFAVSHSDTPPQNWSELWSGKKKKKKNRFKGTVHSKILDLFLVIIN